METTTTKIIERAEISSKEINTFLKQVGKNDPVHIRILDGDEDAMGPIWFFEGFAILAADQFRDKIEVPEESEMLGIINCKERTSYKRYGDVIRYLIKKVPLPELVRMAGREDFIEWIIEKIKGS